MRLRLNGAAARHEYQDWFELISMSYFGVLLVLAVLLDEGLVLTDDGIGDGGEGDCADGG